METKLVHRHRPEGAELSSGIPRVPQARGLQTKLLECLAFTRVAGVPSGEPRTGREGGAPGQDTTTYMLSGSFCMRSHLSEPVPQFKTHFRP